MPLQFAIDLRVRTQPQGKGTQTGKRLCRFALVAFAFILLVSLDSPLWAVPEIPGAVQSQPIAIVGATLHPVASDVVEKGTILFETGKITQLGKNLKLPENTLVIDAEGSHVYPGLFNTDGSLGLLEINSVRATLDFNEVGSFSPNVRAEVAINPDSELIPVTRSGGVLLNLTAPSGGRIAGTSAVLQLDGWTWEDITLRASVGMHLSWPAYREAAHHDDQKERDDAKQAYERELRELEQFFETARAYDVARTANADLPIDLRWESMRSVLSGVTPLVVIANWAAEIEGAVAFSARHKVKLILYGGYDAGECLPLLRSQNVPVIVGGIYRLPLRRNDPYDHPFTLPQRLHEAGITFCIAGAGRFDAANIRNLPYHAAMAVGFGLPTEVALRAITLSPAEILGVAHRVGSLEAGKDATLIVTDGPVFETDSHVVRAFVQGRAVDLSDRHKRLYKKYQTRQQQLANE